MSAPSEATPATRSRRRVLTWAGVALLLVGLGLSSYVGWQVFGTNAVSHGKQVRIVERTERSWARLHAGPSARVTGVYLRHAQALVRIPRFGKHYVVPVQEGVDDEVLAEGFGHFEGTAGAGQVGNFALAAHRVTHGEPLRRMPELRPGDKVVVQTGTRTYVYRLDTDPNDLIVGLRGVWVVDPLPRNPRGGVQPAQRPGQRLITLTTCSELFHTDNRMIAFGHLVSSRPS